MYILEVMSFFHVFFHSVTDGFSNLLPIIYEMLHRQAATIIYNAHTSDHFVCSLQV